MNINYINHAGISVFKDTIFPLTDAMKRKIFTIVSVIFCSLALVYICYKFRTRSKPFQIQQKSAGPKEEIKGEEEIELEDKDFFKLIQIQQKKAKAKRKLKLDFLEELEEKDSMKPNQIGLKKVEPQNDFNLDSLQDLEKKLSAKIVGQSYAIKVTVEALMRHATGLRNPNSPIGTFLYVGPTGVGKTQLAKELALEVFGNEKQLIRMDMSAFTEQHSLTRLIGSLPGYKQHDDGGQLTEALKRCSKSIVLLDEIDKAHPDVLKVFLQAFDEGYIRDAQGTVIDCRQAIFILTSNLAAKKILDLSEAGENEEVILENIKEDIVKFISPELYNRLEVAPFLGLGDAQVDELVKNMLKEMEKRLLESKQFTIDWDPAVIEFIKTHGLDYELGARPLKRLLEKTVVTEIAREILAKHINPGDCIRIYLKDDKVLAEKKQSSTETAAPINESNVPVSEKL